MGFSKLMTTLVVGCSILFGSSAWAVGAYKFSGFLGSYPEQELTLDPDGSGGQIYRKADINLGSYDKIMIEPIEVWMADDSKYKGFSPDQLKLITDSLYSKLVENLEPDYPVVSRPGEGVLVIRLAITDIYATKKKRGLFGYLPIGAIAGAVSGSYSANLQDATIEVELLDAQTKEQLGVLIDKLSISQGNDEESGTSWEQVTKVLDFYAKRFRARVDNAHGK